MEVTQLLAYELAASDLVKNIKVTAVFHQTTRIVKHNATYSIHLEGFDAKLEKPHHIIISLHHELNTTRKVKIHFMTTKRITDPNQEQFDFPEIHAEGTDRNGDVVFR